MGNDFYSPIKPGVYHVRFTNNMVNTLHVDHVVVDANGHPILLVLDDGAMFNWGNIISIKEF